jgi:NhaP-type Na+/H+ or K+/H+ antiporter
MEDAGLLSQAGLSVALAMAAGMIAQAVARHLDIPGIVLLIGAGVLMGPDVSGLVEPRSLGPALFTLVGFAVAVILFEGGMNLNLSRLREAQRPIRQMVTAGALVTAVGGAASAGALLGWDWRTATLLGTLVVVTGPTVVNPLLKRLKVERGVATVLEAEGILGDAVGAIASVVALEIVISPSGGKVALAGFQFLARLGFGAAFGLLGGLAIRYALRFRDLIPEGLENVFTLSLVLSLYQGANALVPESGIAAVMVAGIVVGNLRSPAQRDLLEFKEQLTVLLIGLLFVLLAADVRLAEVRALGWPGLATVGVLMFLVRPLNVLAGTWGTRLNWRQRAFMAWMAPRGIVAAAVASLFASELARHGVPGGGEFRAMVFLTIAITVLFYGLTGGVVARLLGLRRRVDDGWVILGANELALALARSLESGGEPTLCVDTNPEAIRVARQAGLRALPGNGLEERTLLRAEIDSRAGAIGLTPNDEVNLLFAQKAKREGKLVRLYAAVNDPDFGTAASLVEEMGGRILFGRRVDVALWAGRIRGGSASVERWVLEEAGDSARTALMEPQASDLWLALAATSGGRMLPAQRDLRLQRGAEAEILVDLGRAEQAHRPLREAGWRPVREPAAES